MFVCVCNALKETEMAGAIAQGANSAQEIYACLGCQPKCGRCVPYVEQELLGNRISISDQPTA